MNPFGRYERRLLPHRDEMFRYTKLRVSRNIRLRH